MKLISRPCPVCKKAENKLFLSCVDHTVSKETFNIVQCQSCAMVYTNPIPNEEDIGRYYQSSAYVSHSDTRNGLINKLYHLVRAHTLKNKTNLIFSLNEGQKGSILDIGCGTGYFLDQCKREGWAILGTEPDEQANKLACEITQTKILSRIEEIPAQYNKFDVITLWHVLEHIHALNESVNRIASLIKPQGKIVIAVPNYQSGDAKAYGEFWAAYDVPRHLYHFSKDSIKKLMKNHGLHLKQILPMPFDSYYVSLMSEKYKNTNALLSYFNAVKNGFISNLSPKDNYSSLIYIFQQS